MLSSGTWRLLRGVDGYEDDAGLRKEPHVHAHVVIDMFGQRIHPRAEENSGRMRCRYWRACFRGLVETNYRRKFGKCCQRFDSGCVLQDRWNDRFSWNDWW